MNETLNCTHSDFTEKQSMQPNGERTWDAAQHHYLVLPSSITVSQYYSNAEQPKASSPKTHQQFSCFPGFWSAVWLPHCQKHLLTCDLVQTDSALLNSSQRWVLWNWWVYYESEGTNTTSTQLRLLFTLCVACQSTPSKSDHRKVFCT